ncbi:MAG: threonine/serine exporter family protein [Lachnospiraceae bacterium]|nr:threonine/serine exporter family protein [Lachnospiraceae bacterium]
METLTQNDTAISPAEERQYMVIEAAMEAAEILLENGAEISRVEETFERICQHFGVRDASVFVLSNGIFATGFNHSQPQSYASVKHLPVKEVDLAKVVAVNQLSRELTKQAFSVDEVLERLRRIRVLPGRRQSIAIPATGLGSAAFCYLFGGGIKEAVPAFVIGLVLQIYLGSLCRRRSKILRITTASLLVTALALLTYRFGWIERIAQLIIGVVVPMIPGVAFVNGIRDFTQGDYIAGSVRLLDALVVFASIALGVGLMIGLYRQLGGQVWM